jgi:hypothetical protein
VNGRQEESLWDMVTNNRVVMATEELQLQVPLKTRSKGASDLSLVVDTHNDGRGWKVPLLSPSLQSGRSLMSCAWWIPLAHRSTTPGWRRRARVLCVFR